MESFASMAFFEGDFEVNVDQTGQGAVIELLLTNAGIGFNKQPFAARQHATLRLPLDRLEELHGKIGHFLMDQELQQQAS